MTEKASPWDQLHSHRRFRPRCLHPRCPGDPVVRFLRERVGLWENRQGRFSANPSRVNSHGLIPLEK
jgi:hypothetical protein